MVTTGPSDRAADRAPADPTPWVSGGLSLRAAVDGLERHLRELGAGRMLPKRDRDVEVDRRAR